MSDIAPAQLQGQPPKCQWNETLWLDSLRAVMGPERLRNSAFSAALPSLIVALGWPGTARSLAALLPAPEVPMKIEHLEYLLAEIGFRTHHRRAKGLPADTARLPAGSFALHGGEVLVYLGQPDGIDHWLKNGILCSFALSSGDTIVAVEPDPQFQPIDEPRTAWFRGLFERMRDEIFALFALSGFINVMALAVPLYTMAIYSTVIPSREANSVWGLALFTAVAAVGGWALRIGRQFSLSRMSSWAGTRIGEASMRKMLSFPLDTSTKPGLLNNVVRMRGFENARQFLTGAGGLNLIDYPFVVIFLLTILIVGGWLVIVPLVSLWIFIALAIPTADYVSSKATAAGRAASRVEEQAGATFLGIKAFHRTGAGSQWLSRFAHLARDSAERNRDYAIATARSQVMGHALGLFTVLATLCTGIVLVLNGAMPASGLLAAMMLIWRITTPAQQGFGSLVRLRQVYSSARQIDQLMATQSERAGLEISSPRALSQVAITVDKLYYKPDSDQDAALNGVSFTLPAGARVAIVGPNSGGKTALLECLAGLRRPQSGRILLNGRDVRQFDVTEYRAWAGYVPQDVPALPMTIREYLRLRVPQLSNEDALQAFARVLGPDWQALPAFAGLGGNLLGRRLNPFSEDTAELRLRYAVAFVGATLGDPAILLLDGVGLGGDPVWEQRVERYLDSLRGRATVIWAPYSTAQIQSSDQLVILDRGYVRHAGPTAQSSTATPLAKAR